MYLTGFIISQFKEAKMPYVFYDNNEIKSIQCINYELFLDKLSEVTKNFTEIPERFFNVWHAMRWLDVRRDLSEFKEALAEYALLCQVPPSLEQYLVCDASRYSIDNRFRVLVELVESEGVAKFFEEYADPEIHKLYVDCLSLYRDGVLSEDMLERAAGGFRGFCYEIGNFHAALESIVPQRDVIIRVFSTQNIRYATGKLNFGKIYKVMKSEFGQTYKGYIAYKGVIIEHLLGQSAKGMVKPSSTAVGLSLEKAVLELYRLIGYAVSETSTTGDFGIDILAQSNTEKIGIQCKNYAGSVGVEAVMQAHSGGHYYGCSRFIVYSASGFTPAALEMASKLKVELLIFKCA